MSKVDVAKEYLNAHKWANSLNPYAINIQKVEFCMTISGRFAIRHLQFTEYGSLYHDKD